MKRIVFLLLIPLCIGTSLKAQQIKDFDFLYEVFITVEDTLTFNVSGAVDLAQTYSMHIPNYTPDLIFHLDDKVGFKIQLQYRSNIKLTTSLEFTIGYNQYVEEPYSGALKPITIPPIDPDDFGGNPDFPFIPNDEFFVFDFGGLKPLKVQLLLLDHEVEDDVLVDQLTGQFTVSQFTGGPFTTGNSKQENGDPTLALFPNPLQRELNIEHKGDGTAAIGKIAIYNATGELKYSGVLAPGIPKRGAVRYQFENPVLPPGLYYYVIEIGDKTYTKTLLKE